MEEASAQPLPRPLTCMSLTCVSLAYVLLAVFLTCIVPTCTFTAYMFPVYVFVRHTLLTCEFSVMFRACMFLMCMFMAHVSLACLLPAMFLTCMFLAYTLLFLASSDPSVAGNVPSTMAMLNTLTGGREGHVGQKGNWFRPASSGYQTVPAPASPRPSC